LVKPVWCPEGFRHLNAQLFLEIWEITLFNILRIPLHCTSSPSAMHVVHKFHLLMEFLSSCMFLLSFWIFFVPVLLFFLWYLFCFQVLRFCHVFVWVYRSSFPLYFLFDLRKFLCPGFLFDSFIWSFHIFVKFIFIYLFHISLFYSLLCFTLNFVEVLSEFI
jgi:hypothetical protein